MGSGMPEIGSRISLISKADIRYEGRLLAVDPDECTIALTSVRSYGTEDRKTKLPPVPVQNQLYEFILFRGSDIKDIRVLTTTIPNDPAIVQLSIPSSLNSGENQFATVDSDFQVSGAAGSSNPSLSTLSQAVQSNGFKSSLTSSTVDQVMNRNSTQNDRSEDESCSSVRSVQNANYWKAPSRTNIKSNDVDDQSQQSRQQTHSNGSNNRSQQQGQNYYQQSNRPQYQQRYRQNRFPQQQQQQYPRYQQQYQRYPQQYQRYPQQSQYGDYNNRDYQHRNNQYRNYNNYRYGYGQRQYVQPLRGNMQRSDNWNNYRSTQGFGKQTNYQSVNGYQNQNRRLSSILRFNDDYDFEQANSQFEEIRSQLSAVKIDDAVADPKLNSDKDSSKKEDSGTERSGGEENSNESEPKEPCYNKVKSFFDQISYEAIERSKGLIMRLDWKTERKINSETFGQIALRRNINNYPSRMNNGNGGDSGRNRYYNNYQNNRKAGM